MTSGEMVVREPGAAIAAAAGAAITEEDFGVTWRVAGAFAASGMFGDKVSAEQAFAKILIGRSLGLGPAQAMLGIHLVKGKPQVSAVTMGMFLRAHGYDYRIRAHDNERCRIEFFEGKASEGGESLGFSEFTAEDAKRAGLDKPSRNGEPSNHVRFPRNMSFSRAMSNGVKWYAPDATAGIPVYGEGELEQEAERTQLVNGERGGVLPAGPADVEAVERVRAALEAGVDETVQLAHDGEAEELPEKLDEREQEPGDVEDGLDERERERRRHIEADRELAEEG